MAAAAVGIVLVLLLVTACMVVGGLGLIVWGAVQLRRGDHLKGALALTIGIWMVLPTVIFVFRQLLLRFAGD